MFERLMLACLLALSVVSVMGTEAGAATCPAGYTYKCPIIGGTKCCGCWKTGSEICDFEVTGLGTVKGCVPGENCPVVTCSVYGTEDLGDGLCDPNTLDPDCGIKGIAFCLNPASNSSKGQGNPFTLETVLTAETDIEKCDKNGRCRNSIEIDPENCTDCCINPNWQFITFTATEFNGEICVCPGGFSAGGVCCADNQRNVDGSCVTVGVEVCLGQRCTADLTGYKLGQNIPYTCTELIQ
jgi:hypothetical protein